MRSLPPLIALTVAVGVAVAPTVHAPAAGAAPAATCRIPAHGLGWEAIFGYRSTYSAASRLRTSAGRVGFSHLVVERVTCARWAVALHGLRDLAQARDLRQEAKGAGYAVTLECRPLRDLDAAWEAVFATKLTRKAALALEAKARRVGFIGLKVLHEPCSNTWLVELDGIPTLEQAREFKSEAKRAGYAVTLRRH